MTQHTSSPPTDHHPTTNPHAAITTPVDQPAPRVLSGWWVGLVALLPIACCGLPLLVAASVTAGSGAVLDGAAGGVLMLAGGAVIGLWGMRRRARNRLADTAEATSPSRDRCC